MKNQSLMTLVCYNYFLLSQAENESLKSVLLLIQALLIQQFGF